MAEVTVPMEETGMLSSIMAEGSEPEVTQEPEPAQEPAKDDRARDDSGRFVAKTEPEPAKAEPPVQTEQPAPTKDEQAEIPSWRLREMREERDAARTQATQAAQDAQNYRQQMAAVQRQLEQLQKPKVEPVDFFQNPEEAMNQRLAPVQSEMAQFKSELRLEMSRELAVVKHGQETVAEVEAAVAKAMQSNHPDMPALAAQMRNSSNPVAKAIEWHQRNKLYETTGGNLDTYREKVIEEAMKDPKIQARFLEATRGQAQANPSVVKLPPSLNKATGSGMANAALDDGDASDGALFRHAMAPGRRR